MGGKKNEWLVAGCSNGCVYFLNLLTSRKKIIEGFCEGDIQGLTCLTRFDNVLFGVQDTTFNI